MRSPKAQRRYSRPRGGGSGGGFFLACAEDFGRMVDHSFPACAFFFFEVQISLGTLIPLLWPGSVHSGSASCFLTSCVSARFPDRFPHYAWTAAWSAHSDFVGSRMYACLGITCHLHFWQNDRSLLRASAVTRGWNGQRIKVSPQS